MGIFFKIKKAISDDLAQAIMDVDDDVCCSESQGPRTKECEEAWDKLVKLAKQKTERKVKK